MCCIDESIYFLFREIVREAFGSAKASDAHRNGLLRRRGGAAREREHHRKVGAPGEPLRQLARFRGAAQNEDAHVAR